MSLSICTNEWITSDRVGLRFTEAWFPRLVSEQFVGSVQDGDLDRAPDPLPLITADLLWTNSTGTDQHVHVETQRAPRSLVVSNPNTVVLDDAVSWDVGDSPNAPRPSMTRNGIGARLQLTRPSQSTIRFGTTFADRDDGVFMTHIGRVRPDESLHFRYMCLFSTPGAWRTGESPRTEAYARWARLRVFASPMIGGAV